MMNEYVILGAEYVGELEKKVNGYSFMKSVTLQGGLVVGPDGHFWQAITMCDHKDPTHAPIPPTPTPSDGEPLRKS